MFHHIAYVSLSRTPLERALLSEILEVSVRNNRRDRITGVLMYHDDLFFQVLEGARPAVEQCYARICNDTRHSKISKCLEESVQVRSFAEWHMGYVGPDEIGAHTKGALSSLQDLRSAELAEPRKRGFALDLARHVFKGFQER